MTCGFLIQLVFTSSHQSASPFHSGAPPPRKNPGFTSDYTLKLNARFTLRPVFFLLEYRDKKQSLKQRKVVSETQLPCQISAIKFASNSAAIQFGLFCQKKAATKFACDLRSLGECSIKILYLFYLIETIYHPKNVCEK